MGFFADKYPFSSKRPSALGPTMRNIASLVLQTLSPYSVSPPPDALLVMYMNPQNAPENRGYTHVKSRCHCLETADPSTPGTSLECFVLNTNLLRHVFC